jgi:hypothetical protein
MIHHFNRIVEKIHSSRPQTMKVFTTVGVYTALFLVLLHTRLVMQKEFLQAFSNAFLSTWFLCGLLALLLVLFLLKDLMSFLKELFLNTAESIYGSMVLVAAFSLSGYLYSIPASKKLVLGHRTSFLMAFIVYCVVAVYLKKTIYTMAETRRLQEKIAFVVLVCASFGLTWFVKTL